jgi:hypothetical protein
MLDFQGTPMLIAQFNPVCMILTWLLLGGVGGYIVAWKGYPPVLGIIIGIVVGPIGLVAALLLPSTRQGREFRKQHHDTKVDLLYSSRTRPCPRCRRLNSITTTICPRCEYRFPKPLDEKST